ncbi:MAG TPA: hypothetical protein VL738_26155 [Dactylosporangium sp.]|nr:hypothetical protein [Dactylosporangium sp.]
MTVYDIVAQLPDVDVLLRRCRALAVLERVVGGGGDEPYYSFADDWALMRNGSGDEWDIVFGAAGVFIRVFDHESRMSPYRDEDEELWPGLLDGIPPSFRDAVEEPAFSDGEGHLLATAVIWREAGDDRWHAAEGIEFPAPRSERDTDPDGAGMLEILLDDIVDRYVAFAEDYFETEVDRAVVERIVRNPGA